MRIDGRAFRTIWLGENGASVEVIDQRALPHRFALRILDTDAEAAEAIADMTVRGAPLIGAAGAYGVALAMHADPSDTNLAAAYERLLVARPTAVNLRWALDRMRARLSPLKPAERRAAAYAEAARVADQDSDTCERLGQHGAVLIANAWERTDRSRSVNVLTHCNAGWLAAVDWGTALAPVYTAHRAGVPVHVWVDETRPRNQGASLTAYELLAEGVPHTVVVDNVGGHLMQHGKVDLCIVGTDRTTRTGDVCNKVGTYLKALAAHDNGVPFYVALPSSTVDWRISDRLREIPIEERSPDEVMFISGETALGAVETVRVTPRGSPVSNYAFDVTPARLVTGLITERGICAASEAGLTALFPGEDRAA